MASKTEESKKAGGKDETALDIIRAQRYEKEFESLKAWEEKWGFLKKNMVLLNLYSSYNV